MLIKRILVLMTAALVMAAMMLAMAMPAFADQPTYLCTKPGELNVEVGPSLKHSFVKDGYECLKVERRR